MGGWMGLFGMKETERWMLVHDDTCRALLDTNLIITKTCLSDYYVAFAVSNELQSYVEYLPGDTDFNPAHTLDTTNSISHSNSNTLRSNNTE